MANENGKTLGEHLESLGSMKLPITGKPAIDKTITKVMFLGGVCVVGVWAFGGIADVLSLVAAGVDAAVSLLPTKGS